MIGMKRISIVLFLILLAPQWLFAAPNPDLVLRYVNEERLKEGLTPLRAHAQLVNAATVKANEIARLGYLVHTTSPAGVPWDVVNNAGYTYSKIGENLSVGYATAREVVDSWLQSSAHRNNILGAHFEDMGFASAKGNFMGESVDYGVLYFGVQKKNETPSHQSTVNETEVEKQMLMQMILLLQELLAQLLALKV